MKTITAIFNEKYERYITCQSLSANQLVLVLALLITLSCLCRLREHGSSATATPAPATQAPATAAPLKPPRKRRSSSYEKTLKIGIVCPGTLKLRMEKRLFLRSVPLVSPRLEGDGSRFHRGVTPNGFMKTTRATPPLCNVHIKLIEQEKVDIIFVPFTLCAYAQIATVARMKFRNFSGPLDGITTQCHEWISATALRRITVRT